MHLARLPWSLVQQLQSVLNSECSLELFGLKQLWSYYTCPDGFDIGFHDPQRITWHNCHMIMFKCLTWFCPCLKLLTYCTSTSLVPGRLALRSAAHGDIVVPSHRTDWGTCRSFAVAGPSSMECFGQLVWGLQCFWFRYFCKALKNTSIWFRRTHDRARTFEYVLHFVGCDTVTLSPNQIIIIIIITYLLLFIIFIIIIIIIIIIIYVLTGAMILLLFRTVFRARAQYILTICRLGDLHACIHAWPWNWRSRHGLRDHCYLCLYSSYRGDFFVVSWGF